MNIRTLWKRFWWLFGVLILAVLGLGSAFFVSMIVRKEAAAKFSLLQQEYEDADCAAAAETGSTVTGLLRLGLDDAQLEQADAMAAECAAIEEARDFTAGEDYSKASKAYAAFLKNFPNSPLFPDAFREAQETFLKDAEKKFADGLFPDALAVYKNFLVTFPQSDQAERAKEGYQNAFRSWVEALRGQSQYPQILNACEIWVWDAVPPVGWYCEEIVPDILWDWGQALAEKKDFAAALEKYKTLAEEYPTTSAGSQAILEIPQLYFDWGAYLYATGRKAEAVSKFVEALKIVVGIDPIYSEIWEKYPESFIAYADWLRGQGKLRLALEVLDKLSRSGLGEEVTADAAAAYAVVVEQLAGDGGSEGQSVIRAVDSLVCGPKPSPVAIPSVDYFKDRPGKAIFCFGGGGYYPAELVAQTPGELRYFVKFTPQELPLQTCRYGDGSYTLTRIQLATQVDIYLVDGLRLYAGKKFLGPYPSACPQRYTFYSKHEKLYGASVDRHEVKDWLTIMIH